MKIALLFLSIPLFAALVSLNETGFQKLVSDHKGKVVLYDFWATWCDSCRAELPQLVRLEAKLRSQGFELVTISADEPEAAADAEKLLKQFAVRGVVYRKQAEDDQHFIDSIDPKWSGALPAMFLYDKTGHQVQAFIGETDIAVIEAAIRKVFSHSTITDNFCCIIVGIFLY
jgi:thiol-disulfide isomerase/thioredoxin